MTTPTADQPTLDAAAAEQAAQAGIEQAAENAEDRWKREARAALEALARRQRTIVSDDVWATGLLGNPTGSNTALGHIFRAAARDGIIAKTDRVVRTEQVRSHGSPMTVWRSLVHPDAEHDPTALGMDAAAAFDLVDHVLDLIDRSLDPEGIEALPYMGEIVKRARRARP